MSKRKKLILLVVLIATLVGMFSVGANAYVNPAIALNTDSAVIILPFRDTWAIETTYLPFDFNNYIEKPLFDFELAYQYEVIWSQSGNLIIQDDALSPSGEGWYYSLFIESAKEEMAGNEYTGYTSYTLLNFAIGEFDTENNLRDIIFENPKLSDEETAKLYPYIFCGNIMDSPENVSDFFSYMYPYLPLVWLQYNKEVLGDYELGVVEGERRAKARIDKLQFQAGYDAGKDEGFQAGYEEAIDNSGKYTFRSLIDAVIFAPVNGIVEMMNFDILGVNVSSLVLGILSLLIVAGIVLFIVRFFV